MRRVWDRLVYRVEPPGSSELPQAAVLAALYEDEAGELRMVLTKRPDTMPTHAGHIAFPGGRPHPGDSGPVDTALREAQEEVGIDPSSVEVLGFLPEVNTVSYSLMVVPVVGRLPGPPRLVPDEREVVRVYHPLASDLADDTRWRHENWQGRTVWFYDLEGDVLWGATAWMIRNLLGLEPA
jgi:8-oxo-dGTP pyrophosphatase MutT (NUDIX family)